ncbi:MAG: hypothetical protein Q7S62_02645 [bacterium]|nr:hypothetical protein [bacterium]
MTKRTRTILFLFLAAAFLFAVPSLILYSQGYRIDWKLKQVVQTGALYFKIIPTRTDITVDGKTPKTTDFFFGSALLGNLFPGSHKIQISKEGYQPWTKQLEIQEKQVTDAKNVILFPEKPEFTIAADNVQQIWKTPKENTLLLQKNTSKFWKLVLFNTETLREETIFTSETKETLWDIQWSPSQKQILLSLVRREDIYSFILALEKGQPCNATPCSLDFLGKPLDTLLFSNTEEDRVIFSKYVRNSIVLREANFIQKEMLATFANNVITFTTQGSILLWLESSGKLWQKDTPQNPPQMISSLPTPLQEETEYSIHGFGDALFLREGTRLLSVDTREKNMKEVFSQAHMIAESPDGKKLAVSSGSEIWVLYLQDSEDQPYHLAGDKVFLTRLSNNIDNLLWISSHYLVFSAGTDIQTIEIDERDTVNTAHLIKFPDPKLFWQEASKVLTVLSQGNLYVSEILVK